MKSQIPKKNKNKNKKNKKNGGIVEFLIPTFLQKKLLMRGQNFFSAKKLWRGCSKLEE